MAVFLCVVDAFDNIAYDTIITFLTKREIEYYVCKQIKKYRIKSSHSQNLNTHRRSESNI